MSVINLKDREQAKQEAAWAEYVEAAKKSQQSLDVMDGIAAGQAFGKFVRLFCPRGTI